MQRPSRLWILGLALAPSLARAEVGVAPFSPEYEQQLVGLDDFSYDSDWFPADAALQLRLIVHAGNSVTISMPGEASYDWNAAEIRFEGAEGGAFGLDIGLEIDAKIRFDVLGVQWESDILGPYDYAVIADASFTPYLLAGDPERPVVLDDVTDPVTVVSVPVTPDIVIAAGNLDIDVYAIVAAELRGESITVATDAPSEQVASIVEEGASAALAAGPGPEPDPFVVRGALTCGLMTAPTLVLKPTLVMEILGQEYEIADIEVPVALPPFDDLVGFEEIPLSFPRPPPAAATTGGSEGESHGMSGGDDPTAGTSGTSGSSGAEGSSGPAGGVATGGPGQDEGCGCHGGGAPPLAALLVFARRRRRRG